MTITVDVQLALLESNLPPQARHVVLTLCVRADFDTGLVPERFTPSLSELTEWTGLSRHTVIRHRNVAEQAGWLVCDRPSEAEARRHGITTTYRVQVGRDLADAELAEFRAAGSPKRAGAAAAPGSAGDAPGSARNAPAANRGNAKAGAANALGRSARGSARNAPDLVREMHQPGAAAAPIKRKTPTGSTPLPTSHTNQGQRARTRDVAPNGRRPQQREPERPSDESPSRRELLLTEHRESLPRGLAAKVAEQLAAQIQVVIDDPIGFTDNEIRGGLGLLNAKGLGPTFLPQMVTQYANQGVAAFDNVRPHQRTSPGAPRPSTTDQRVMAALQLGAEMEAARTGEPVKPVENPFAQLGHPIQPAIEGAWK